MTSSSASASSSSLSFARLVEESNQLMQTDGFLPQINPGPKGLEESSKKLAAKTQGSVDGAQQIKAHYLLANKGFDADKYTRNLNSMGLATFEPLEPIGDTDIQGFLRHEHEMLILTAIEEAKKNTISQFNQNYVRGLESDWERVKKDLEAYKPKIFTADTGLDLQPRGVVAESPISAARHSALNNQMRVYSNVVYELNNKRLEKKPIHIMKEFKELAADKIETSKKREISDLWQLLASMSGEIDYEDGKIFQNSPPPREGQLERHDEAQTKRYIRGARLFLGSQYYDMIIWQLKRAGQPSSTVPDFVSDVRQYVLNLVSKMSPADQNWERDNFNCPFWALIFYCLRCERFSEALAVAEENNHEFASVLVDYLRSPDNRLSGQMSSRIQSQYKREFGVRQAHTYDPFKKAVYNIIGRCDVSPTALEDRTYIRNIQDYMWMELALCREGVGSNTELNYSILHLRQKLQSWDKSHFKSDLVFFQVLILTSQFEVAIDFLRTVESYLIEAVHFAIALRHYGMLRITPSIESALLVHSGASDYYFNFAQFIAGYANTFSRTDSEVALEYLYLLNNIVAPQAFLGSTHNASGQFKLFHVAFRDLALETRDIQRLLGGDMSSGVSRPGLIHRFVKDDNMIQELRQLVAKQFHSSGRIEEAVQLFRLANDYSVAFDILNQELKNLLASPTGASTSRRAKIQSLALSTLDSFGKTSASRNASNDLQYKRQTLGMLIHLTQFFDLYYLQDFENAGELLLDLDILPSTIAHVAEKKTNLDQLPEEVRSNIAELILAGMTIWYTQIHNADQISRNVLRARAEALVHFSTSLRDLVPSSCSTRLLDMWTQICNL